QEPYTATLEEFECFGRAIDECEHARFIELVAADEAHVGENVLTRVLDAFGAGQVVPRDPESTVRSGGAAAARLILLEHDGAQAKFRRCERGRQSPNP